MHSSQTNQMSHLTHVKHNPLDISVELLTWTNLSSLSVCPGFSFSPLSFIAILACGILINNKITKKLRVTVPEQKARKYFSNVLFFVSQTPFLDYRKFVFVSFEARFSVVIIKDYGPPA